MSATESAARDELAGLDGLAQVELFRRGELSARELLEAAIARAEAINPAINAINRPMYDEARETLRTAPPNGPYAPLPFLLKDIFANYVGVPTTAGSRLFADTMPARDAELVRRYKVAGLLIFGKATTSELGSLPTTEASLFGPTRNPWSLGHTAGGSSGGGAAAVAARIVPAAQGSDGAGSIRIPASCCGLVGLKPTRARITLAPDMAEGLGGTMVVGVMTLSVRDTAGLLDASEGPVPGDPYWPARPTRPFLDQVAMPPGGLRIAATRHSLIGTPLDPDCVAAVDDAAALCAALGHEVVEDAPDFDAETYYAYYKRHWQMSATRTLRRVDRQRGCPCAVDEVDPFNRYLFEEGMKVLAADYIVELEWLQQLGRLFAAWQLERGYDTWLTPTLGCPPAPLGWFTPGEVSAAAIYDRFMEFLPFTPFANLSGQPAISLPLFWNAQGLPIGVHFTGHYGDEATLLRLAGQLERARPWIDKRPPLSA
jgi:amidase